MTINSISAIASTVVTGLGTQTFNVTQAGIYTCAANFTVPYLASGSSANSSVTTGGSALQIVINLNGSPLLTTTVGSPTQATVGGTVRFQAAVNDVVTVVLSSSAAADAQPNAVKGIINLYQGE